MSSKTNHDPQLLCAENIALLSLLHTVPRLPSHNLLQTIPKDRTTYALSIAEEQRLVEALAFLANDSEDVNHIPALCIQEIQEPSSLSILIAVNQSRWQDGDQALSRIGEGFRIVFAILARVEEGCKLISENDLLQAIVSMCTQRILHRLRLVRNRWRLPKPTIQDMLRTAIERLKTAYERRFGPQYPVATEFISMARDAVKAADGWEKHQTTLDLMKVVNSIQRLRNFKGLEGLLDAMNNREMDPNSRKSLINVIKKVSRYGEVARYLCRASKRHTVLRSMRPTVIGLPFEAYARLPLEKNIGRLSLQAALGNIYETSQVTQIGRICHILKTTEHQCNEKLSSQAARTLREGKIHAEIQLLYHLELNPYKLPPRVIASSKDACFLCNAFITMHGKMHTTRTHGRLYPGWKLPSIPHLICLEQQFNAVLARQVQASIETMVSINKQTVHPDPNESTLLTLPHSASTLQSSYKPVGTTSTVGKLRRPLGFISGSSSMGAKSVCQESESGTSQSPTDPSRSKAVQALIQGQAVLISGQDRSYAAGSLTLHLEYPAKALSLASTSSPNNNAHILEWLSLEDQLKLSPSERKDIIDVCNLKGAAKYCLNVEDGLLLASRGIVLRISTLE